MSRYYPNFFSDINWYQPIQIYASVKFIHHGKFVLCCPSDVPHDVMNYEWAILLSASHHWNLCDETRASVAVMNGIIKLIRDKYSKNYNLEIKGNLRNPLFGMTTKFWRKIIFFHHTKSFFMPLSPINIGRRYWISLFKLKWKIHAHVIFITVDKNVPNCKQFKSQSSWSQSRNSHVHIHACSRQLDLLPHQ